MFKHILFPTDGSPASSAAILECMKFAQEAGARVTALHVLPEYHAFPVHPAQFGDSRDDYMRATEAEGMAMLAAATDAARDLNVPCETAQLRSDHPYEAILAAARDGHCDMIAMATHGYKGMKGMLLGSETHRVLMNTEVPVLVFRPH